MGGLPDHKTKANRRDILEFWGFEGTVDCTLDLQSFTDKDWRRPELEGRDEGEEKPNALAHCKDDPFETVEHVAGYLGPVPEHCVPAMDEYNNLIKDGYSRKFGMYADAVARSGNKAARGFKCKNGNKYFDFSVILQMSCCKNCLHYCPGRAGASSFGPTSFASFGIKNITWEDVERQVYNPPRDENCRNLNCYWNFPVTDYSRDNELNPKDVVEKAYKEQQGFVQNPLKAVGQMQENTYTVLAINFVNAVSVSAFMVREAVGSINKISDMVDKWEKNRRKIPSFSFLAPFFFRSRTGPTGRYYRKPGQYSRIPAIIGAAAETAIGIYSVIDSEGNDPMAIFGLVPALTGYLRRRPRFARR
ncbi:hypothetical protein GGTG_09264 [Gaeumannomyces tritici R3-111a-1]|uniref:Uncharacterized protein n=1 Tax=Gaeumannomyces tritici (strain R3-111a-1) TaxID=644352 RepID=J3P6X1_GAET3|nr:hypothetical protein GGTG_09264 [Gaeumannomyces tritici R3-111a-1]EJT72398.1 hypothetical protein GGTG_09264 [Gaeumannomyces tritici R3-111a-1]